MNVIPTMDGRIERRLLVNLRVAPELVAPILPAPLRPMTVGGSAIAGICFIRLAALRPAGFPASIGLASENAAHRIAVEWDDDDGTRTGVWIPRRHSASRLATTLGGRAFPAVHTRAHIDVWDAADTVAIRVAERSATANPPVAAVTCRRRSEVAPGSVFATVGQAEEFFRAGTVGFSPGRGAGVCDGVELAVDHWDLVPLEVVGGRSQYFEALLGGPDRLTWDSAFLMRDVACRWRATPSVSEAIDPRTPNLVGTDARR